MIEAYVVLHKLGYAHSIEAWRDGKLTGGLYGVSLGGMFFGECGLSSVAVILFACEKAQQQHERKYGKLKIFHKNKYWMCKM